MGDTQYVKFVSQKVSKVRWRPTRSSLQRPDIFISGSCEDTANNSVNVWSVENPVDSSEEELTLVSEKLRHINGCKTHGNVDDILFVDPDNIVAGLGNGDVVLMQYNASAQTLDVQQVWESVHETCGVGVSCTGIDCSIPDVVTVGEDGCINILRLDNNLPLRKIARADSVPTTAVCYSKQNEVCTVNKMGQLKIWDVRTPQNDPSRVIMTSDELVALESICRHPAQPHVLAAGGADGCVTTFDIRKEAAPVTKLQVHDYEVWEVQFHPSSPDNLFTCSEDGAVRRLDVTSELKNQDSSLPSMNRPPVDVIELLNCRSMGVNSLSVSGSRLVCGTDAESIYLLENVL